MGFMPGKIMETTDAGVLKGIQKEIACECWFTSTGNTIPRFIKIMNEEGQIFCGQVLSVEGTEQKRFSGIETVEHICRISFCEKEQIVKLILNKIDCKWKIIFL